MFPFLFQNIARALTKPFQDAFCYGMEIELQGSVTIRDACAFAMCSYTLGSLE